jgi:DNA-binding GntR family transcriptional regulator
MRKRLGATQTWPALRNFAPAKVIMTALREHNGDKAAQAMRVHLSRIQTIIDRVRESHASFFANDER